MIFASYSHNLGLGGFGVLVLKGETFLPWKNVMILLKLKLSLPVGHFGLLMR